MAEEEIREYEDLPMPPGDFAQTFPHQERSYLDHTADESQEKKKVRRLVPKERKSERGSFTYARSSFTMEDVDGLIQEAHHAAQLQQGTGAADRLTHSQTWRNEVSEKISAFFSEREIVPTFDDAGRLLRDLFSIIGEPIDCRPLPMDRKMSVFPLPVPEVPVEPDCGDGLYSGMVNSLHGASGLPRTNAASLRAQ